jgi:hypothetical protein
MDLTDRPVALPLSALRDGMGAFRAHLYATFHSGRTKDTPYCASSGYILNAAFLLPKGQPAFSSWMLQ